MMASNSRATKAGERSPSDGVTVDMILPNSSQCADVVILTPA